MKCENCMWQITESCGQVVDCRAGLDDKCPTEEDIEAAARGGYLAFYGCHTEVEEEATT